jgi:hypothetical protein
MKLPFSVKIWEYAFTHVIVSLRHVSVAVTFPVVFPVVEYATFAVGAIVSIHPLCKNSSALCIISITYHLISGALAWEIFFIIQSVFSALRCFT